jgi:hypothetical protein
MRSCFNCFHRKKSSINLWRWTQVIEYCRCSRSYLPTLLTKSLTCSSGISILTHLTATFNRGYLVDRNLVQKQTNLDVFIFFTIPAFPYVAQATLSSDIDGFLDNFRSKVGQVPKIRSASSELRRLEFTHSSTSILGCAHSETLISACDFHVHFLLKIQVEGNTMRLSG